MFKRTITILTLLSFILYLCGCSSNEVVQLNKSNIDEIKDSEIVSVVTSDYKIYEFDTKGVKPRPQIIDSLLIGWIISERESESYKLREVKVPVSEIRSMEIEEVDILRGSIASIGIFALIVSMALAQGFN